MEVGVCLSVCLSVFLQKIFLMGMDQARKFGEQTSRILEFKPKGLISIKYKTELKFVLFLMVQTLVPIHHIKML